MSKNPTSVTPVDKKPGDDNKAPAPVNADDSVDTGNPNDAIERFNERLREEIPKK
jgi:hypothetical protein